MSEPFYHDENDDMPVFHLEVLDVEIELKKSNDDTDFIFFQYGEVNKAYSAMDDPAPPSSTFELIGMDEILPEQMHDQFCTDIRRKLYDIGRCHFNSTTTES